MWATLIQGLQFARTVSLLLLGSWNEIAWYQLFCGWTTFPMLWYISCCGIFRVTAPRPRFGAVVLFLTLVIPQTIDTSYANLEPHENTSSQLVKVSETSNGRIKSSRKHVNTCMVQRSITKSAYWDLKIVAFCWRCSYMHLFERKC